MAHAGRIPWRQKPPRPLHLATCEYRATVDERAVRELEQDAACEGNMKEVGTRCPGSVLSFDETLFHRPPWSAEPVTYPYKGGILLHYGIL